MSWWEPPEYPVAKAFKEPSHKDIGWGLCSFYQKTSVKGGEKDEDGRHHAAL